MRSSSTAAFCKLPTCPSTEALLRHTRGGAVHDLTAECVADHLIACDFCAAEAQLLAHLPERRDVQTPPRSPIPAPLLRLAEELLMLPSQSRARFAGSLLEIERLTLTDA